jgi:uncharacterized membrane protein YoaK (UPF0700 family)
MIAQLPKWVLLFGGVLAFVAGIINVVGFLSFEHQAVTHLTGTTSLLGAALATGDSKNIGHLLGVIVAFVLGSAISGAIVKDSTLKLGRRYGVVLSIESIVLLLAVPLLNADAVLGTYFAGMACGLQNAMASAYSGTVIRTSHVTGMFTDVGISIGHAICGLPINRRRFLISVTIIASFLLGGVAGAVAFKFLAYQTLYIPAAIVGCIGPSYMLVRTRFLTQNQ